MHIFLLDFAGPLMEISSAGQNKVSSLFTSCDGYFSADLKSFLSHSLNMHFPFNTVFNGFFEDKSNVVKLGSRSAEILSLEAL